jgi:small basic protein (TIGR04137 family)
VTRPNQAGGARNRDAPTPGYPANGGPPMSIHKSLAVKSRLARTRNVLSRWERIEKMRSRNSWQGNALGLPKVAGQAKVKKKKK